MTWAPEADPQNSAEVREMPRCPEVVEVAKERGITSVVHFTRIRGLVGILAAGAVKARRSPTRGRPIEVCLRGERPRQEP